MAAVWICGRYYRNARLAGSASISQDLFVGEFSSILESSPVVLPSLDDFIGSIQQQGLRDRKPDLLCRLEIDDQLELRGPLYR